MALCPCTSGAEFRDCCEPYLSGARKAPTPEALMRSRYTAYATHRLSYIEDTLHPRARSRHDPKNTAEWSHKSEWKGLTILATSGGEPESSRGTVEFIARYRSNGEDIDHHEVAEFRRDSGTWYFVDGRIVGGEPLRREGPKVLRNDPCPCGSGKKYKKCCGT